MALAGGSTASAAAQPAPIIVTGHGLPSSIGDSAYDLKLITRERLTGSASARLEDVLRDAAGFHQFRRSDSRSTHPTSQGATLRGLGGNARSEEHTSELQSLMRNSYAVFCLKKNTIEKTNKT